jgi:hypothetical protein
MSVTMVPIQTVFEKWLGPHLSGIRGTSYFII